MVIGACHLLTEILDLTFPVVIAGGLDIGDNVVGMVEIVDNYTKCKVDPFPMRLSGAVGVNGIVCGGQSHDILTVFSSCWHLNPSGTWTSGEDMLERRYWFSLTKVEDEVIAIGGIATSGLSLKSTEKYSLRNDVGWSRIQYAPKFINRHCTVMLNTSYLMIIGGAGIAQVNSYQQTRYLFYTCKEY